ncbi:hypothetical protein J6590_006327 [Homalodisca vitripennis]|nr:hypothetical protein J6590_006327 [Homalodisca vitripennis]
MRLSKGPGLLGVMNVLQDTLKTSAGQCRQTRKPNPIMVTCLIRFYGARPEHLLVCISFAEDQVVNGNRAVVLRLPQSETGHKAEWVCKMALYRWILLGSAGRQPLSRSLGANVGNERVGGGTCVLSRSSDNADNEAAAVLSPGAAGLLTPAWLQITPRVQRCCSIVSGMCVR